MKVEGKTSIGKNHQVAYKLASIKGLLDKLNNLDDKINP